jgi:hypothetical protein
MQILVEIILESKYLGCREYQEFKLRPGFQSKSINIGGRE